MVKKPLELEDIAEQIVTMGTLISGQIETVRQDLDGKIENVRKDLGGRMDGLDGRMDKMEGRMGGLENRMQGQEIAQRETNQRLSSLEGSVEAIGNDIKELYVMVTGLRRDFDKLQVQDAKLEARIARLEAFAEQLAEHAGLKFPT